jgi:hypothetical protein
MIIRAFAPIGMMEYWNNGIMDSGIMQYCFIGKIFVNEKIKNGEYPFKNQPSSIPLFHIRGKRSSLKKYFILSLSCRNSATYI